MVLFLIDYKELEGHRINIICLLSIRERQNNIKVIQTEPKKSQTSKTTTFRNHNY